MAADAPAGDREAELFSVRCVTLAGVEIEPCRAQPADRQLFQHVTDREDAQGLATEVGPLVLRGGGELELQRPLTGVAEPRAAKIGPRRGGSAFGLERCVHGCVDAVAHRRAVVEIEHQNGISDSAAISAISARNASTVVTISRRMSFWVS